jgi:hypothetical protein
MMIPLLDALSAADRAHLRKILNSSVSMTKSELKDTSKVAGFLREDTYIVGSALQPFKELSQDERERMMSELVWRITCHLDKSVTRVLGVHAYPLGKSFTAIQSEREGRDVLCLAVGG